ncbi:hypothetical protein BKA23_0579 [Rudaeicoccus suwonensis]|uniref:Uncharacterized protein n=1 Tax=Rudaeicoccus suwonensis TaxID=657409 RepID=A0A561E848_9MICO|nr:hypothetical protein BKA23_0579 [Rudaeicoccus suwonensis]
MGFPWVGDAEVGPRDTALCRQVTGAPVDASGAIVTPASRRCQKRTRGGGLRHTAGGTVGATVGGRRNPVDVRA